MIISSSSSSSSFLPSIIGGIVIAVGLYCVVWGKSKDYKPGPSEAAALKVDDGEAQMLPITAADGASANGVAKL